MTRAEFGGEKRRKRALKKRKWRRRRKKKREMKMNAIAFERKEFEAH